jgi:hypothetical protein
VRTHRLRTAAIAGVTVALVLTLPSLSSASPQPRADTPYPGVTHAQAKQILDEVTAALTAKPQRRFARGETLPHADLTMKLRDLRVARSSLTRSERITADQYLARPSASSATSACDDGVLSATQSSTHFCLHYSTIGLAAATPEQVSTTLTTLEHVWTYEVGTLGFRAPPSDGDEFFDVYLQDVGSQGLYGYCAPDHNMAHSSSYCVLDNDYDSTQFGGAAPINSLQVTAAHEFFHAVQFGYDTFEDIAFMEGTAVWAEEQVYPAVNDYLQYLAYSAITHPRVPADYNGNDANSDVFYRYGSVLFWKFLSERYGTPAIVRRVWEYADGSRYSLQAVSGALAERGTSFATAFARFGAWNTKPSGSYGDRALFPSVPWWLVTGLNRSHRDTGRLGVILNHLTNAALYVRPGTRLPKHTRARILVNAPALVRMPRALVQLRLRNGSVAYVGIPLDANGDGSRLINFDPRIVAAVVVTLTNASTRNTGCGTDYAYTYACGGQSADDGVTFLVRAKLRLP